MGRGRPRQFDPDEVLSIALEVFWDHGFEDAGVEQILQRSGVGRQSLYNTFGDKRRLFGLVFERYAEASEGAWEELLAGGTGPLEGLRRFLDRWSACPPDIEGRGCLMVSSINALAEREDEIAEQAVAHLDRQRERLRRTFEDAVNAGELPSEVDPRAWSARWPETWRRSLYGRGRAPNRRVSSCPPPGPAAAPR